VSAPSPLKVADAAQRSVVMVHKAGFGDAVVWSPGEAKAGGMGDLGAAHWRRFVCLEVAQARGGAVQLEPGAVWEGSTTLEYDTLGES
jgi:glucose-6-phosphate 1-epimerase